MAHEKTQCSTAFAIFVRLFLLQRDTSDLKVNKLSLIKRFQANCVEMTSVCYISVRNHVLYVFITLLCVKFS